MIALAKLLGIDPGLRWVGLAVSDEAEVIASPLKVLDRDENHILETLRQIVDNQSIDEIVIGYPKPLKADSNERTRQVDKFIREYVRPLEKPFYRVSERYTSSEASRLREERGDNGPASDDEAAAVILQYFLDNESQFDRIE